MHSVIYVPGLGDAKDHGQRKVVAGWRRHGVEPYFYSIQWRTGTFDEKFSGLLALIDRLAAKGPVSLVGVSAGASVVLQALAARPSKVVGVATICGKVNHPDKVNPRYYIENPAFKESLARLQNVLPQLDAARILVVRPLWDNTVPVPDTFIPGAKQQLVPTIGHVFSIAVAIVCASRMLRFLKSQAH